MIKEVLEVGFHLQIKGTECHHLNLLVAFSSADGPVE